MLEQLLRENINIGDAVVHKDYGLGRFMGLDTIENNDYLKIIYANNSSLYIPVEDIESITRYGDYDDDMILDSLGNTRWIAKRQKIREKLNTIARDLIKIAAQRQLSKAPILVADENEYREFCDNFEYDETPDQLKAIRDIEGDLTKGIPADRLVCGDVGFGKTEVALRAAFIVASNSMQVAIICPTTLLCRQHYNVFSERFANTGVSVAMVSRLSSGNERTKKAAENGGVDIVIGTHALLSFKFKNLGLLIVDEEQRFGVKQKEKLKAIGAGVHLLTLSATPIPRTLQMAMTGIRDLSLIITPPTNRLNVDTKVMEFDEDVFRGAISREVERSGKVLVVVPRITDIVRVEQMLKI